MERRRREEEKRRRRRRREEVERGTPAERREQSRWEMVAGEGEDEERRAIVLGTRGIAGRKKTKITHHKNGEEEDATEEHTMILIRRIVMPHRQHG